MLGGIRNYRRTVSMAALSAVLVAGTFGAAAGVEDDAGSDPFATGTANAVAMVSRVAPGVGALELALGSGIAVSEVTNQLAQAQSQTLDLGLIGTALTAEDCTGSAPIESEQLPQALRVDNRGGDVREQRDEAPLPGGVLGAGRSQVEATTQPRARAVAITGAMEVDPVVTIGGGRAVALTEVIPGTARQARASAEADLDLAGVVQLRGMRWEALHRTGEGAVAEGSFTVGSAGAAGVPLPVDEVEPLEAAINTALGATGLSVRLPRVEHRTEPVDIVRVTPMRVVLRDSPAGRTLLGPVLDLTRDQRAQLFDQMVEMYCQAASFLFVGDVALTIASGTGFLAFEIGGAEAATADLVLGNPFGTIGEALELPAPDSGAAPPPPAPPGGDPSPPPSEELPGTGAAPAPGDPDLEQAAARGPTEERCESVHPFGWPPCSTGAAGLLGAVGLLATTGMGVLDWTHRRRRLAALPAGAGA